MATDLKDACAPFCGCVVNRAGVIAVDTTGLRHDDWVALYEAVLSARFDTPLVRAAQPFANCVEMSSTVTPSSRRTESH